MVGKEKGNQRKMTTIRGHVKMIKDFRKYVQKKYGFSCLNDNEKNDSRHVKWKVKRSKVRFTLKFFILKIT